MPAKDSPALNHSADYVFQLAAASYARPQSDQIYFAARSSGLFRSCDGGRTWESAYASLNTSEKLPTTSIAIAPDFEHEPTIFAGLNGALLRSYDSGTKWQRGLLPTPPPAISALCISPDYAEDGVVFAGTTEDGVLVSQDRGGKWVTWNFGLLDLHILCLGISPGFATDETLFAGTESGLFRSTNGGRAWREVSLPISFDPVLSMALSPHFAQDHTLLIGTENHGILSSADGGQSWQVMAKEIRRQPVNQILLPNRASLKRIVIVHGGDLLITRDGGKAWKPWGEKKLRGRHVASAFMTRGATSGVLVGFEDGSISRV